MNLDQLRTLAAIIDEGSFEGAAYHLGVTQSAVSQRVKALEAHVGQLLVRRESPCSVTAAGSAMLRLARQVQLLQEETWQELSPGPAARTITPLAVNADSLATWLYPVLRSAVGWSDITLDLHVEDQDHSSALLRTGEVLGAITAEPQPINGCTVEHLGDMRYLPVADPLLAKRHTTVAGVDWESIPALRFNSKDDLQHDLLRSKGITASAPAHVIPSSEGFLDAVRAGLGWGMLPQMQLGTLISDGSLVLLEEELHRDVALYWQTWNLESARLRRVTQAIREAAADLH